jgi:nitroreductase
MEFYDVIKKRHTIREFAPTPITEDAVRRRLDAGLQAPSHNHLREWEFLLIRDMAVRQEIVEAGEHLKDTVSSEDLRPYQHLEPAARDVYLHAVPLQKRMLLTAPELLVVCYKITNPIADTTRIYDLNNLVSAWCCIENILLAMAAEGVFSVTYIPQHTANLRTILNIPETYEIPVLLPFGYPAEGAVRLPQKPVDLDAKLHINTWAVPGMKSKKV